MNLYLLFAIALGAIAGTTEAPVARPAFAVVAKSGVRAEKAISEEDRHFCLSPARGQARVPVLHGIRLDAPLTGAASPRAPAA
jgi:hypothetical protein